MPKFAINKELNITMKRLLTLILLLMGAVTAYAQVSIHSTADENLYNEIRQDVAYENYVWSIGYGDTLTEADNMALSNLASIDLNIVAIHSGSTTNDQTGGVVKSTDRDEEKFVGAAMMSLTNIHRIDLSNIQQEGSIYPYVVLRYVTADEWAKRYDTLKTKIEGYIESAELETSVVDQLRDYTWALAMLSQYGKNDIQVEGKAASLAVESKIAELLGDIQIKVTDIKEDKSNKNYPYTLYLDFMYDEEPLSDISFSYFDGGGYVEGESVKDGRGMVAMKKLPDTFPITIDCFMEDSARQRDPGIYQAIQQLKLVGVLRGSQKDVETTPKGVKPRKEVDTNESQSEVAEALKKNEAGYGATTAASGADVYRNIMSEIVSSFQNVSAVDIRRHFTDKGWSEYNKIVKEGNPVVARTPSWNFVKLDTLVICRELPVKLKFPSSRKAFIEDVVFRINERTKKVESVAYKLSANTEKCIMAKDWPERDRLTLITFLEDYRSAYCLRDIAYIKKVFSDDAYIITGKVLQRSKTKYNDKTELIEEDGKVVYTRQTKKEYVENLSRSFKAKEFVNVRFEECDVCSGYASKKGIYAVQVRQFYTSNNYADEGILTLAIDMREEVNPLVRVRVWQQERDVNYTAEQMMDRTVSTEGSFAGSSKQ